jgi:colanic acid biosynthesis protein WcaH
MLVAEKFIDVIEHTQLVSIDLIVYDDKGQVLIGKRSNEPARGMWFVPGSRLYKNETIDEGVKRVARMELGVELCREDCQLLGVYDHMYDTNFLERIDPATGKQIPTHYVAIGMKVVVRSSLVNRDIVLKQHSDMAWVPVKELLEREDVHQLTKNYINV